jgi:hypothetical protein
LGKLPNVYISYIHDTINTLSPELNPICHLLALLAHHFLHVSRIRIKPNIVSAISLYCNVCGASYKKALSEPVCNITEPTKLVVLQ